MKFIVIPDKIKDINDYDNDTFIVGLKNYSINYPEATLEEIKKLSNKKDIFVSINKNIFNSELEELKNILLVLEMNDILFIKFEKLCNISSGIVNIFSEIIFLKCLIPIYSIISDTKSSVKLIEIRSCKGASR